MPQIYGSQVFVGIAVLYILSLIIIIDIKEGITVFVIGFSTFIAVVLGYPLNTHLEVELMLYLPLLVAVFILIRGRRNIVYGLLIFTFAVLMQKDSLAWGRIIERPALPQMIFLMVFLGIALLVLYTLSRFIGLNQVKENEIRQLETIINRLTMANLGFQDYSRFLEEQARTNERNRITRELHDVVGYTLTNIAMMMEESIDLYKKNDVKEMLSIIVETRDHARSGHTEIRDTLQKLRTIEVHERHVSKAINNMVNVFKNATKLDIDVDYTNFPLSVGKEAGSCIIRLIQEGMTNAIRHGRASYARVLLYKDGGELVLSVSDNGEGCVKLQEGLGITGMRERVRNIGGKIKYESTGEGFQFIARIPESADHTQINGNLL